MQYLVIIIGVILVIVGLWLSRNPVYEGMADTSVMVMAMATPSGINYANKGLTNTPNWASISSSFTQLSGSMGRIVAVQGGQAKYGTKYDSTVSTFNWVPILGSVTQVSFDYPMVVALTAAKTVVYIDNITFNTQSAQWVPVTGSQATKTFNYIATSQGSAYGSGTDNNLWYCPDIHNPVWVNVSTGVLANIPVKNISYDVREVAVIDTSNRVYFADTNISTTPNWVQQSATLTQVSIKNHMGVGISTNGTAMFASSVKAANWTPISGTGSWIEIFFATGSNTLTFRPASISKKVATTTGSIPNYVCNTNEVLQNGVCVSLCPDGSYPDGELCQTQIQVVPPTASVKCTSSPYGSSKKWLCNSSNDADTLLIPPSKTTSYVSDTDQVCISEDDTTRMYYCVSGAEAKLTRGGIGLMQADFSKSCDTINKNYIDLSNNITSLLTLQSGVQNGSTQLGAATTNLQKIYTQMNCTAATGSKLNLCKQIENVSKTVGANTADVTSLLNTLIPQMTLILNSRDTLLGFKRNFQCP